MLIDNIDVVAEVQKRDRNWRIRISSELDRNGDYLIECYREVVLVKDGRKWEAGGLYGERKYLVSKRLSEIASDTVTLPGGITLTGAQIALALEQLSDKYAESETSSSSAEE